MKASITNGKNGSCAVFTLPGDKSIAHRSLIIGALGEGKYMVSNFPSSQDCTSTLSCMTRLGIKWWAEENNLVIHSPGHKGFNKEVGVLDAGNSGTTARLITGLLCGINADAVITGDESLRKRPMNRIINPLTSMGASIESEEGYLPLKIFSNNGLTGIEYQMPVASAQVKSAILIAGFLSKGKTIVRECKTTRDHSERMFKYLGAEINFKDSEITINESSVKAKDIFVPGDVSTAAFIIACAILSKDCSVTLKDVLLNEGRRKYLDILKNMGAEVDYTVERVANGEEVGTIAAKSSILKSVIIEGDEVAQIIDEVPIISILASFAEGTSIISGVDELKYKESNRVNSIIYNLRNAGFEAKYEDSSILLYGKNTFISKNVNIETFGDHRIALAFAAFGVRNSGETLIDNWDCTEVSFPDAKKYLEHFLNINLYL